MADVQELKAVIARFAALAADWKLDEVDVAMLLALDEAELTWPPEPPLPAEVEHRMRLAIELDGELRATLPPGSLVDWLHDDAHGDGLTPLAFLAGGIPNMRAMRSAAKRRV